jgi:hypothetical protein
MIWTSIVGIIALVGLARVLGFAKNPALDIDTARAVVEAALPGFIAETAEVEPRTRTATVTAHDGRTARVVPHGDRWVVRA